MVLMGYLPVTILFRRSLSVMIPMGILSLTTSMAPTFFSVILLAIVLAEVVAVQVTNFLEYCTDCKSNTWVSGATGFISGTSSYNLPLWLLEYGFLVLEAKLSIKKLPTAIFLWA